MPSTLVLKKELEELSLFINYKDVKNELHKYIIHTYTIYRHHYKTTQIPPICSFQILLLFHGCSQETLETEKKKIFVNVLFLSKSSYNYMAVLVVLSLQQNSN